MLPILLVHGYSSEGQDSTVNEIYGALPDELRKLYGDASIVELNLSRWISLNDGLAIDDISFAMDRALKAQYPELLKQGFNVIIHSTGALVVRNWIKQHSPKPSPINNLIHLAGANFGSGLAHIGRGQLARWTRFLKGTGRGMQVLHELEIGSSKTLDLHLHFLKTGQSMFAHYQVQEFCLIGSQTLAKLRPIPIRYLKEDSSDNTVRTSAGNLNFNWVSISPTSSCRALPAADISEILDKRLNDEVIADDHYQVKFQRKHLYLPPIPFSVIYETAHSGGSIGIVSGTENRHEVMPLVKAALETEYDVAGHNLENTTRFFAQHHENTFTRAATLKSHLLEWNKQEQYEAHAQVIFRLRDQFGNDVTDFDITLKSDPQSTQRKKHKLESMIEHSHINRSNRGTIVFYLRTQKFRNKKWHDQLKNIEGVNIEISGYDPRSGDIAYLPVNFRMEPRQIRKVIKNFETTLVDVQLMRLPSERVFAINPS